MNKMWIYLAWGERYDGVVFPLGCYQVEDDAWIRVAEAHKEANGHKWKWLNVKKMEVKGRKWK